jgi:hypothetical protein
MIEAYFDESGSHEGSAILCIAGFLIESGAASSMDLAWTKLLADYSLPFFHMEECAHGIGVFKPLSLDERIAAETRAIGIMREFLTICFVISVDPFVFDQIVPVSPLLGSAYSVCANACLHCVQIWADQNSYKGDIAYFFENGHKSQSEANEIMRKIFSVPRLRERFRYASHTFAEKRKVQLLQAADIVAWLWHTESKRKLLHTRPRRRADLTALMKPKADGRLFFAGSHLDSELLRNASRPIMLSSFPLTFPR